DAPAVPLRTEAVRVEEDERDPGGGCTTAVDARLVADEDSTGRLDSERLEGEREDRRVRLRDPHLRRDHDGGQEAREARGGEDVAEPGLGVRDDAEAVAVAAQRLERACRVRRRLQPFGPGLRTDQLCGEGCARVGPVYEAGRECAVEPLPEAPDAAGVVP